ncbi:MAG: N-6 DNA methylase [Thermodesulfobacteriota bacterium]
MASRTPHTGLDAIRVEGGLLPAELLARVAALEAPQQSEADYRIPKGLKLRDEIGRAWRIAAALWRELRRPGQRPASAPAVFLVPFLREVLGFVDLAPCPGRTVGERRFPISHAAAGGRLPVLLTAADQDLDVSDPRFGDDGRRRSPHGCLQELLNADEACLWGLCGNGLFLRLLRDNPSLTRPASIEVDCQRLFEEELYPDFAVLWLVLHRSRFEPPAAGGLPVIETWRQQAALIGERVRERLCHGVADALRLLGSGFLAHPANEALRAAIRGGGLGKQDFFQQLLRLVYRLIFLFTLEDRRLLPLPAALAGEVARDRYARGYSLSRLRERAGARGVAGQERYRDLWEGLLVTFRALAAGEPALALPALGGLFAPEQCLHLDACCLANGPLLAAVRHLGFFATGQALARINYRDMDTEELGSVYESLLELVPDIRVEGWPWTFGFVGDQLAEAAPRGTARKLTGSYYTPDSLVQELVASALEPVLEEALRRHPQRPAEAILGLRVLDPACGSGHFLLAAARRLAGQLARVQVDGGEPTEEDYRHALRQVIGHCLYGVDANPLAVELCRTGLWLEGCEIGKPLGFLDAHIRHGNSLVGVLDPALLARGIPEAAYKPLTGDDRALAAELKKTNKRAAGGRQLHLFDQDGAAVLAACALDLDAMPEESLDQVEAKRAAWQRIREGEACRREHQKADLYCAAFFAAKTREGRAAVPTSSDLARLEQGMALAPEVAAEIRRLAREHGFFHWHLAFPEVFADGRAGFDVVLGNPPWERVKLQEQEFFASRSPRIASAPNAAARTRLIQGLGLPDASPADRQLHQELLDAKRAAEAASQFARTSGRFPLTGRGDVNLYALFAELFLALTSPAGRAGIIVPTGIATDDSTKAFFDAIVREGRLVSLLGFREIRRLFPGTDSRDQFCLLTLGRSTVAHFVFQAASVEHLHDARCPFGKPV